MICEVWVAFGILARKMFYEGEANGLFFFQLQCCRIRVVIVN